MTSLNKASKRSPDVYYTQNLESTREKAEERGQKADPEATVERCRKVISDWNPFRNKIFELIRIISTV